jgi:hypothetical protein
MDLGLCHHASTGSVAVAGARLAPHGSNPRAKRYSLCYDCKAHPVDPLQRRLAEDLDRLWLEAPLALWMIENEREVLALIEQAERVDWADLAASFASAGLLDVRNRLPDAETAAETWRRVRARPRFW